MLSGCGSVVLLGAKAAGVHGAIMVAGKEIGARLMDSSIKHRTPRYAGADMTIPSPYVDRKNAVKYIGEVKDFSRVSHFRDIGIPKQLMNRTSWHPNNVPTYNDLAGSMSSVTAYENTRDLYYDIVNGDVMPSPFEFSNRQLAGGSGMLKSDYSDIDQMPKWGNKGVALLQRLYKIPDSHLKFFTARALSRYRSETQPGWAIMAGGSISSAAWAVRGRTTANCQAVIYNKTSMFTHNEHPVKERPYRAILNSTSQMNSSDIVHPFQGIKTDSLDSSGTFMTGVPIETFHVSNLSFANRGPLTTSYQSMVFEMESIGVDWVAYHQKHMNWPAERHKLYTANFPYRGLTKKPVGAKGFIRQKGGNSKRVVEWHPELKDHYETKTEEELFA